LKPSLSLFTEKEKKKSGQQDLPKKNPVGISHLKKIDL